MTDIAWFASANEDLPTVFQDQFVEYLAKTPHRVDILLTADDMPGTVPIDLLQRLARHPKVGSLIIYKAAPTQRPLILAQAILYGLHVRFCDTEDELRILINKRRSRAITSPFLNIQ